MKRLTLCALLLAFVIPATSFAGEKEESTGDANGLQLGIDGGYAAPRGHDYHGRYEDGLDAIHGYVGYRALGFVSFEVSALDIQAPIKGSQTTADIRMYSLDGRVFIPLGPVQPNFLVGYAPVADLHEGSAALSATAHGYAWNLGAGGRFVVVSKIFLTLDFRHSFIRYTKGEFTSGGTTLSGTFDSEQRGDVSTVLVGGGFQF